MADTAETAALGLLEMLMQNEKLAAELRERPPGAAKRWLFNTYGECLRAVIIGRERADDPANAPRPGGGPLGGGVGALDEDAGGWGAPGWSPLPEHPE